MTDLADSGAAPADAAPASDGLAGDVGTAVAQAGSAAEALDAAIAQATPGVADAGGVPNAPASASATPESVLDGDLADGDTFGRSYVESIRNEGRNYREQLREAQASNEQWDPYRQSLEQYEDADRQVWLNLMDGWRTDPRQAAEMMQQIASGVLGEGDDGAAGAPDSDAIDAAAEQTGLTAEQVSKIVTDQIAAREAQVKQQAEVDKVFASIKEAGYDPQTAEGFSILWRANNETSGDIGAAIKAHEASRQQVIDDYVAGRAAGATPLTSPSNGVAASQQEEITTLEQGFAAAKQFLDGQRDGRGGV